MQQPFQAKSLTFAYSLPEDRLVLLVVGAKGEKIALLVTRRLTGRLINGLAGILEKSSPAVSRAPAEMREDVVLLEHQEAVSGRTSQEPSASAATADSPEEAGQGAPSAQIKSALLTAIDVSTKPTHFELALKSGDSIVAGFNATRHELHRTLSMLKTKAQEADWNLSLEASWLGSDQSMMVIN
jgi:hypothetical protein